MYREKNNYIKTLKCINIFGNSKERYIEFSDNNLTLIWKTNDYNLFSTKFRKNRIYQIKFKINYIFKERVWISYVKIIN